jgi:hypothetical protein
MGGVTEHHPDIVEIIRFIQNALPTRMPALIPSLIKLKDLRTT